MAVLKWNKLVGQDRVKNVIGKAYQNGTLGHAYLFCGERGTGKFAAAVDLAMALLCQHEEARPCKRCPACKKADSYSHPDFHVIMPLVLQSEHKKEGGSLSDEGWALAATTAKRRISDPYRLTQYSGIPNIPVDWIREANEAIMRGGTEGPANVVIIDGVDTMSDKSANAMLKTLEEPPPGTVMILLTDKHHAVLPTIVSRCQTMRFTQLTPDQIKGALYKRLRAGTLGKQPDDAVSDDDVEVITFVKKEVRKETKKGAKKDTEENDLFGNDLFGNDLFGNDLFAGLPDGGQQKAAGNDISTGTNTDINEDADEDIDASPTIPPDPRIEVAALCGSLGVAIEEFEETREECYETAAALWNDAHLGDWDAATQAAERLAGGEDALSYCQKTLLCLIQLLRFAFFRKTGASMNYINLGSACQISLPETAAPGDTENYVRLCQNALGDLRARGNPLLVMVNFACTLMEMLNGEEQ